MPEFTIHKGVDKPIEFRGLKGKYAYYLVGGVFALFILFILLYVLGVAIFFLIPLILGGGIGLFMGVYHLNRTYGQWGLLKRHIHKKQPHFIVRSHGKLIRNLAKKTGK